MIELIIGIAVFNAALYVLGMYLLVTSLVQPDKPFLRTLLLLTGLLIAIRSTIHEIKNQITIQKLDFTYALEQFVIALFVLMCALAIRKYILQMGRHNGKLTYLLTHDALTAALSRFDVMKRAHTEIERSKRTGHPMALLLIDVDQFKQVNDTYGHLAGDKTLKCIVKTCQSTLREIDLLGRMGGDEFIAILPETSLEAAHEVAKRMIEQVRHSDIKIDPHTFMKVSISIGIALYQPDAYIVCARKMRAEAILKKLIARADQALYEAKNHGRGCFVQAKPNWQAIS